MTQNRECSKGNGKGTVPCVDPCAPKNRLPAHLYLFVQNLHACFGVKILSVPRSHPRNGFLTRASKLT